MNSAEGQEALESMVGQMLVAKLKKLGVVGNMELSGTVNNGDLTLVAKYKMKFWFNLFKTEPLDLSQKVKVHLWGLEDY